MSLLQPYDFGDGTWGLQCQLCGTIHAGKPLPRDWSDWSKGFSNGITSPEQALTELGPDHVCKGWTTASRPIVVAEHDDPIAYVQGPRPDIDAVE